MKKVRNERDTKEAQTLFYDLNYPCSEYYYEKMIYLENKDLNNKEHYILDLLEKLGFSINEVGTFLYKKLILSLCDVIEYMSTNEIKELLKNPYSQLYFDVARNDLDMGCLSFHSYIEHAISVCNDKMKKSDAFKLLKYNFNNLSYGEAALFLAKFISNKPSKDRVLRKVK